MVLGEGVLSWHRHERVADRYGAVVLLQDTSDQEFGPVPGSEKGAADFADAPIGEQGTLVAEVIDGRMSGHIGDLFHGFRQTLVPKKKARFELGSGELFTEEAWDDVLAVGVNPGGRETFWLDPRLLYEIHNCVVRLTFEMEV